jgi:SAM-dependent methyltransferase
VKAQGDHRDPAPSTWVRRFAGLVPAGSVLDVACGTGRHCRLFLDRGHHVVGVDRYNAGVIDLLGRPDFELIETDLESDGKWPLQGRKFAAVIVTNYLYRPLFPALIDAVAPDGCLIYETFAVGNERHGRPSNPDFLLAPGELLDAVAGRMSVVAYEHGLIERSRRSVVQRICAVRSEAPDYLASRGLDGGK